MDFKNDIHKAVDLNKSIDEMTDEEKWRMEHQKLHEQHKGHDAMHLEIVLILFVTLIVAQILLVQWKQWHYRSYLFMTMLGMWIIPLVICIKNRWWRFIIIWVVFSILTTIVVKMALKKPLDCTTPRLVYKWFYLLYKISYVLGIIGYITITLGFFGLSLVFDVPPGEWIDIGVLFVFYGLYFGVLGRDIAEICADKMASHIGYYTPQGMPTRNLSPSVCAVCGNRFLVKENEEGIIEDTYKLSCGHVFHEFCIRGWCIVGKKEICPYCKEKVDLKALFCNPWERPHMLYGQLLDWIRWLLAWQPLIFFLAQGIAFALGLE